MDFSPTKRPEITFYIDPRMWPQGPIPDSPDVSWTGYHFGPYCWAILTVLHLQRAGYDCRLSSELPAEGIVIVPRDCCDYQGARIKPDRRRLLINMAADIGLYPWANLTVVQNPTQAFWYKNCHFIPLWPEPGLKPRISSPRFKNISFLGQLRNFAANQDEWTRQLDKLGLTWVPRMQSFQFNDPSKYKIGDATWSDMSEIDAIVAVRRFTTYPTFDEKPPSKLINCWLGRVPAILGAESAYRALYRSELDYFEVHSPEEVIAALIRLRDNPQLRESMIENGRKRSIEINSQAIVRRWIQFLEGVAIPSYLCWIDLSKAAQTMRLADNHISMTSTRMRRKLSTRTGPSD